MMKLAKLTIPAFFLLSCVLRIGLITAQEELPECPAADTLLPHPDCRYYYQCSNFIPIFKECGPTLYFNPRIPTCDHPINVPECEGGTRPPITTAPPTEPTMEAPSTNEPPVATTEAAPTTTEDDSTSPPATSEPATTEEPTKEPPTTTEPSQCPPEGRHNFPHPGNCSLYIRCFDGEPLVLDCAPLIFDKIDLICKAEADAVCSEEDPIRCPADGFQTNPHDSSCSKYYECFNGNLFEFECSAYLYFDARLDLLRCNQAELAVCNSECPPSGYHYLPIRERNCKWYKVCIEGYSANLECGENEVFDPDLSRCASNDAYVCPYS